VGVVKDYHHEGLQRAIMPMIFYPAQVNDLTLRVTTDNLPAKIATLGRIYQKYFSGNPFEYYFLDDLFNRQYAGERQYGKLFTAAALLAILIACLGLFGLTVFAVESRTKEIGIRKVLGATVAGITSMLSKDFLKLVLLAMLLASPLAWYFMKDWLMGFAYRVEIEAWVFVLAGLVTLLVALLTVCFHAIRAALANPVKSLRTE
jgi:putative ABC transport system permease protein